MRSKENAHRHTKWETIVLLLKPTGSVHNGEGSAVVLNSKLVPMVPLLVSQ